MPKKKGKGKRKGGKAKGKGKSKKKTAAEKEDILKKTKDVLKTYVSKCSATGSSTGAIAINSLKQCIEEEKPLMKVILDSQTTISKQKQVKTTAASKEASSVATDKSQEDLTPRIRAAPLLHSLLEMKYIHLRCIHFWRLELNEDEMVELSKFMESKVGHEIRVLELIGNGINTWSLCRISRTFPTSQLVHITLDYNRIDEDGIQCLCSNLLGNLHLNSLNLNYCDLSSSCGDCLGVLASSTQLRYLSIRGNKLRAKGAKLLIQRLVSVSEVNEAMPLLARLFLQDNEIDGCGDDGIFAPVSCMEMMKRWFASCKILEEVQLDGNLIGELAARELLLGLKRRKEEGYTLIQLSVTSSISNELFMDIKGLVASTKGKKKGKKGKKKKK